MILTTRRQYLLSLAPEPSDFMNGLVAVLQGNLARTRYTLMPARCVHVAVLGMQQLREQSHWQLVHA